MASSSRPRTQRVCIYFNRPRGCFRGAQCKHLHIRAADGQRAEDSQPNELAQPEWISKGLEKVPPSVATKPKPRPKNFPLTRPKPPAPGVQPSSTFLPRRPQFKPRKLPKKKVASLNDIHSTEAGQPCPTATTSINPCTQQVTSNTNQFGTQTDTQTDTHLVKIEVKMNKPAIESEAALDLRGIKRERDGTPIPQSPDLDNMSLGYPPSSPPIASMPQRSSPMPTGPRSTGTPSPRARSRNRSNSRVIPSSPPYSPSQYRSPDGIQGDVCASPRHVKLEPLDQSPFKLQKVVATTGHPDQSPFRPADTLRISNDIQPKLEATGSGTLGVTRFLHTSGTRYYGTVPPEFDRSRSTRKAWGCSEARILEQRYGLEIKQIIMRDDGMAIDWSSPQPVWNDTLLPETRAVPKFSVSVVRPQSRPITPLDAEHFLTHYLQSLNINPESIPAAYSRESTFSVQLQSVRDHDQHRQKASSLWHNVAFRNLTGTSIRQAIQIFFI